MKKRRSESAFTLIEIAIAIMILAMSLVTLLGLQASSVDQSLRTRNKTQAMLMARQIMSAIELEGQGIEPMEKTGPAIKILNEFIAPDPSEPPEEKTDRDIKSPDLQAYLRVEPWDIPNLPRDVARRVTLRIFWSDNPADSIETIYFVPSEVKDEEG